MQNSISISLPNEILDLHTKKANERNLNVHEYIVLQLTNLAQRRIKLSKGFNYDVDHALLFNKRGDKVSLTPLESKLFHLLITNPETVIDVNTIKDNVWGKRYMSVYTMRNVINKLRDKTYYDIIKTKASQGYIIDSTREA